MPLDGGKLISLNEDGSRGTVVLAIGTIFRIGYLMNNDYILQDDRALPTHCEICCDAWDRITIHNKSDEYPVKLNDQLVLIKSPLFSGSKITILQATFLWEFEKPESNQIEQPNLTMENAKITPLRQEDEKPAAYSCPDLRFHREISKRLTVHNFAYCIHHNEEGNTSSECDNTTTNMSGIAEELEDEEQKLEEEKEKLQDAEMKKVENERCTTPDLAQQNNNSKTNKNNDSVNSTPITQLLNATGNKSTKSIEKKSNLSYWQQSDVLITSFTPRETGVRIDKSFTILVKPKMTPKSLYSTPKSLLYDTMTDCEQSHNMTSNFATPATSKAQIMHRSSMHMVDFTTPKKLAPASPMPKSMLKKSYTKITPRQLSLKEHAITITPSSNVAALCKIDSSTYDSGSSVQCVDSSPDIIEISGEDDSTSKVKTPLKTVPPTLSKIITPKRTPQTLRKRVLLNSAKKTCMTVDRNQSGTGDLQQKFLAKRLSLCTPPRKNLTLTYSRRNLVAGNISTSTPKSNLSGDAQFMPSTSKSAASSSLYGIRKSVGNTTFSGRITKNRTPMALSRSMVCVKSQQILAKACKTLISPPNKIRLTTATIQQRPLEKSAQKLLKKSNESMSIPQAVEKSQNVEQNLEEQKTLNVTFSPIREDREKLDEESLNATFCLNEELTEEQSENVEKAVRQMDENDDEAAELQENKNNIIKIYEKFDAGTKFLENEKNIVIDANSENIENSSGRETDELLKEITEVLNKSDEIQRKRTLHTINKENKKNNVNEKIIKGQLECVENDKEIHVPSMPLILNEMENNRNKLKTPLKSPNLCGIRELMQLPRELSQATPNFTGIRNLFRSPKSHTVTDNENLEGVKWILQTPPPPPRRSSMTADMEIRTCATELKRTTFHRKSLFEGIEQRCSLTNRRLLRRRSVGGFETEMRQTDVHRKMLTKTDVAAKTERNFKKEFSKGQLNDNMLYVGNVALADYVEEEIPITNIENDKEIKSSQENSEEDEDFIPETQAIELIEKHDFDCFLKSPRAKNLMVSTCKTDILDKTDDDINSSDALEFVEIFKPLDEQVDAEETNISHNKKIDDILETTEQDGQNKNLSSEEENFDKLLVTDESSLSSLSYLAQTPIVSKANRSNNTPAFSPFAAADVISDLPKTDIEVWVNSMATQKPNDNNDEDSVNMTKNEILKSSTPTIEEEQQQQQMDAGKSDISGITPLDKSDESSVLMEQLRLSDDSDDDEPVAVAVSVAVFDEDEEIPETQMPYMAISPAKAQSSAITENASNENQILENEGILNDSQNEGVNSDTSTICNTENEVKSDQDKTEISALEVKDDNEQESKMFEDIFTNETQNDENESIASEKEGSDALEIKGDSNKILESEKYAKNEMQVGDENSLDEISNIIEHEEDVENITEINSPNNDYDEIENNAEDETKKHYIVKEDLTIEDEVVVVKQQKEIYRTSNSAVAIHDNCSEIVEEEESDSIIGDAELISHSVDEHEIFSSQELEHFVEKKEDAASDTVTVQNEDHGKVISEEKNSFDKNDMSKEIDLTVEIENAIILDNEDNISHGIISSNLKNTHAVSEKKEEKKEEEVDLEENLKEISENNENVLEILKETAVEIAEQSKAENSILESENIFGTENSTVENSEIETILQDNQNKANKAIANIDILKTADDEMGIDKIIKDEKITSITCDETDKQVMKSNNQNTSDVLLSNEIIQQKIVYEYADKNLKEENIIKLLNNSFENTQMRSKKVKFQEEIENLNSTDRSISSTSQPILLKNMYASKIARLDAESTFTMEKIVPNPNSVDDFQTPSGNENSSIISAEAENDMKLKTNVNTIPINIGVQIKVNSLEHEDDGIGEIAPTFAKRKKNLVNTDDKPKISVKSEALPLEKTDAEEETQVEQKTSRKAGRKRKGSESESEIPKALIKKKSAKEDTKSQEKEIVSPASTTSSRSSRIAKKVDPEIMDKGNRRGRHAKQLDVIVEPAVHESAEEQVEAPSGSKVIAAAAATEKVGVRVRKPSVMESPLPLKSLKQAMLKATLTTSTPSHKEKLLINDDTPMQQQSNDIFVDISAVNQGDPAEKASEEQTLPETSRPRTRRPRAAKEQSQVSASTPATRTRRARKASEKTDTLPLLTTALVDESAMTTRAENDSELQVVQTTARPRRGRKVNVTETVDTTSTRKTRGTRERHAETVEKELNKPDKEPEDKKKKTTTKRNKAAEKVVEEKASEETKKALPRGRPPKSEAAKNAQNNVEKEEESENPIVENKKEAMKKRGKKASEKSVDEPPENEKSDSSVEPVRKRGRKASEKSVDEAPITKTKTIEKSDNAKSIDDTTKTRGRRVAKTTKKEGKTIDIIEEEQEELENKGKKDKSKRTDTKHVYASSDSDASYTPQIKEADKITAKKTTKSKRVIAGNKHSAIEEKQPQAVEVDEGKKVNEMKVGRTTRGRKNAATPVVTDMVEGLVSPPKKRSTRARK